MPLPLILKRIYLAYSALKESEELQKLSKSTKYEAGAGRLREKESGNWRLERGFIWCVYLCPELKAASSGALGENGIREGRKRIFWEMLQEGIGFSLMFTLSYAMKNWLLMFNWFLLLDCTSFNRIELQEIWVLLGLHSFLTVLNCTLRILTL